MHAGTSTLVSVDEYLHTMYHPDCDYVDGYVLERNLGESPHSGLQGEILVWLSSLAKELKFRAWPEQRVQVSKTRFRIPDICVTLGRGPVPPIFDAPPFLCIEILSSEDRLGAVSMRLEDFRKFGVPYIWVLDPLAKIAYEHTEKGLLRVPSKVLRTENPEVVLDLAERFRSLEEE